MTVSIAMSTYNGERHLEEQLASLLSQTTPPDEVVISDDASTDRSVAIIEEFIRRHSLHSWRLYTNATNVGWRENFRRVLSRCNGRYVLLCDQDDIWLPTRLQDVVCTLDRTPGALLVATSYWVLRDGRVVTPAVRAARPPMRFDGSLEQYAPSSDMLPVGRPGCSFGMRRELIDAALPDWPMGCSHDGILWRMALCLDGLYLLHTPTLLYRRHETNATGIVSRTRRGRIGELTCVEGCISLASRFAEAHRDWELSSTVSSFRAAVWRRNRLDLLDRQVSPAKWLTYAVLSRKMYRSWRPFVSDLRYSLRRK